MRNTRFLFSAAIGERTACKGGKKHRTSFPIRYLHSLLPQAAYSDRLHRVSLPEQGTSSRNGRLRMESVTLHRLDGVITNREPSLRDHRLKGSGTLASDRSDRSEYPVITIYTEAGEKYRYLVAGSSNQSAYRRFGNVSSPRIPPQVFRPAPAFQRLPAP